MSLGTARERENLYEFAVELLKARRAGMVLDVACDYGLGTSIIADGSSAKVVGLDIESSAIALARSQYTRPNTSFVEGDARRMSFEDGMFDAAVSMHTIEHMNERDQALFVRELARVLKPEGLLIIATPDGEVWKLQGIANMQEGHIKELSRAELEQVLTENGFAVRGVHGQWPLKKNKSFAFRQFLNVLKRLDVLRIRRFLGKGTIDAVDQKTQPVSLDDNVVPLGPEDRASVNIIVCAKK